MIKENVEKNLPANNFSLPISLLGKNFFFNRAMLTRKMQLPGSKAIFNMC
jgi:hypothetical protein